MINPRNKPLIYALFGLYLLVLAWAVLWKLGTPHLGSGALRMVNLTPFYNATDGTYNHISEVLANISLFVPFGLYLSLLAPQWSHVKRVSAAFMTSFALEALQYILAIGRSDVSDLIVNTLGGMIGIAIYLLLSKLLGKNAGRVITGLCVAGTALGLLAAGYFVTHIRFVRLCL